MSKKIIATLLFIIFLLPVSIYAFDFESLGNIVRTKLSVVNVVKYIYNAKGKVLIKDALKITGKTIFKKRVNIKKSIINTKKDSPVKIKDNLAVTGNADIAGSLDINKLFFTASDISTIDISILQGGEVYYNSSDKKLFLWNGSSWLDLTNQGNTYTAGEGLTLNGIEFKSNLGNSIETVEITNDAINANQLSAVAIQPGDIGMDDLPSSGSWDLTADLNLNNNTFYIDKDNNSYLGVNTGTPKSTLQVNGLLQILSTSTAQECNSVEQAGRMYFDPVAGMLNICDGITWRHFIPSGGFI